MVTNKSGDKHAPAIRFCVVAVPGGALPADETLLPVQVFAVPVADVPSLFVRRRTRLLRVVQIGSSEGPATATPEGREWEEPRRSDLNSGSPVTNKSGDRIVR